MVGTRLRRHDVPMHPQLTAEGVAKINSLLLLLGIPCVLLVVGAIVGVVVMVMRGKR